MGHFACVPIALLGWLPAAQPELEDLGRELTTIAHVGHALPVVVVNQDDVRITSSCVIRIPKGAAIHDDENDGVIKIDADDVIVVFEPGSTLVGRAGVDNWRAHGPRPGAGWDTLTGTGIVVNGHRNVEIVDANIRGFRCGIIATDAPDLAITNATLTDLYRQRLTSTATREGSADWLWPHENDENQWLTNYGAAIWAERCHGANISKVTVRRGQNGIVLDNTNEARVGDSDCSFLSGWGLAMWRASGNTIERNHFDFCVRGHVEGVYNRGQDSAGILMFEACIGNTVIHNSCTHSGDGIFGFGGNDAIKIVRQGPWGNANNTISANDLSFSPAHGLEMTFSEGNIITDNVMEANAICGIWGGYSRDTQIRHNRFIANGGMAYGGERGAINIEHGSGNEITGNELINNKCGVRLWWDNDEALLKLPGVAARYRGVSDNLINDNTFVMNDDHPFGSSPRQDGQPVMVGVEMRVLGKHGEDDAPGFGVNSFQRSANRWDITTQDAIAARIDQDLELSSPLGSFGSWIASSPPPRRSPPGRQWIVVDQWGPWDFESALMRERSRSGAEHVYEIYPPANGAGATPRVAIEGASHALTAPTGKEGWRPWLLRITPRGDSPVTDYRARVRVGEGWSRRISGRFVNAQWAVRCWRWANDPLTDLDAWRAEAGSVTPVTLDGIDLPFASAGPAGVNEDLRVEARDRFGLTASTTIRLPQGDWTLTALSDDGVRVFVNGEQVIERWDIHGPTSDSATFSVDADAPTTIELEYFENDGHATLRVELAPAQR